MSFSIQYDLENSNITLTDYLTAWSNKFGDAQHNSEHGVDNTNSGGFNPGPFDGTQYGITSPSNSSTALLAEGNLHYTLFSEPTHTLWGNLDNLSFGDGLNQAANGAYTLLAPEVTFSDLGLSSAQSEGRAGTVHEVVYGLMSGDVNPLLAELSSIFDTLNSDAFGADFSALDADGDGTITSAEIASYTGPTSISVDVVGVAETADLLAA